MVWYSISMLIDLQRVELYERSIIKFGSQDWCYGFRLGDVFTAAFENPPDACLVFVVIIISTAEILIHLFSDLQFPYKEPRDIALSATQAIVDILDDHESTGPRSDSQAGARNCSVEIADRSTKSFVQTTQSCRCWSRYAHRYQPRWTWYTCFRPSSSMMKNKHYAWGSSVL